MEDNLLFLRRIFVRIAILLFILNYTTPCHAQSSASSDSTIIVGSDALFSYGGAVIIDYTNKDSIVDVHVSKEKISKPAEKAAKIIADSQEASKKVRYKQVKPNVVFYTESSTQEINRRGSHRSVTSVVPHFRINFVGLVEVVPTFTLFIYDERKLVFIDKASFFDDYRKIHFFTRPPPIFVG